MKPPHRFIRTKHPIETAQSLPGTPTLHKTPLEYIYRLDGDVKVGGKDSRGWREGLFQCIDYASAVAVEALSVTPDDHVLDLCAAPGGKLAICADIIANGRGTATGVDISKKRLFTARAILKRLKLASRVRLIVHDGTTFDLPPPRLPKQWTTYTQQDARDGSTYLQPTTTSIEVNAQSCNEASRMPENSEGQSFPPQGLSAGCRVHFMHNPPLLRQCESFKGILYDKVLVDAECTHDASASHMFKYEGKELPAGLLFSLSRGTELHELQLNLLRNGFRLLKVGGILVYSTCSAEYEQNEAIILKFLGEVMDQASLEYLPDQKSYTKVSIDDEEFTDILQEISTKTLRFDSIYTEDREVPWTSGLFIIRLRKNY